VAPYQFTLREMLGATVILALALASYRALGFAGLVLFILLVIIVACGTETVRRNRKESRARTASDGQRESPAEPQSAVDLDGPAQDAGTR